MVFGCSGEERFLLLLTPHSVRRPDGYCLNELARAFGRSLPIIPVLVSPVEPPLSILWFLKTFRASANVSA